MSADQSPEIDPRSRPWVVTYYNVKLHLTWDEYNELNRATYEDRNKALALAGEYHKRELQRLRDEQERSP